MSGFGYDTTTVWLTIALDAGDPVIVTGRDDGVNGFTWSAKRGEETLAITVEREVLIDGVAPEDDEWDCDCAGELVPGAIWPMASDGDGSKPWVECCGDCQVFDYDDDAAEAIAEKIGGRVEWATLPGRGGALRPYVLPTDYPLPAGHPLRKESE